MISEKDIQRILLKWNKSSLIKFKYINSGRMNIIYRIIYRKKGKISSALLKINKINQKEFYQGNGNEIYLKKIFKINDFDKFTNIYFVDDTKALIPFAYTIMKEIKGTTLNEYFNQDIYYELGKKIASLHKIKVSSFGKNIMEENNLAANDYYIKYFLEIIKTIHIYDQKLCLELQKILENYYDKQVFVNQKPVLLHHDLHLRNVIIDKNEEIWLIDWDSARGGIKEIDFIKMKYFNYKNLSKDQYRRFIEGYSTFGYIDYNVNIKIYELFWLAKMYIFESLYPTRDKYFPNSRFYQNKFYAFRDEMLNTI